MSFSATPPVNPIRGNFWWDGTTLHLFDGAVWVNIGPGAGTGPGSTTTQPVFSVQTISLQNLTANAWVIAPINGVPTINPMSAWDSVSKKFQPNKSGIYGIEVLGWNPQASPNIMVYAVLKNDTGGSFSTLVGQNAQLVSEVTTPQYVTGTCFVQMNGTSDFIRVWGFSTTGVFDQSYGFPSLSAFLLP